MEQETEQRRSGSWKWWAAKTTLRLAAGCAIAVGIARGVDLVTQWAEVQYAHAREAVLGAITVEKVVTEFKEPSGEQLGDLISRVAHEHKLDPRILTVVADKESSGGKKLYRFEPELFERLRGADRFKGTATDEVRMLASSHGSFHVLGVTAQTECKLPWHALYQPLASARCAASILARHWKDTQGLSAKPGTRIREVFRRYNGSGPKAEAYAADALERFTDLAYRGL